MVSPFAGPRQRKAGSGLQFSSFYGWRGVACNRMLGKGRCTVTSAPPCAQGGAGYKTACCANTRKRQLRRIAAPISRSKHPDPMLKWHRHDAKLRSCPAQTPA